MVKHGAKWQILNQYQKKTCRRGNMALKKKQKQRKEYWEIHIREGNGNWTARPNPVQPKPTSFIVLCFGLPVLFASSWSLDQATWLFLAIFRWRLPEYFLHFSTGVTDPSRRLAVDTWFRSSRKGGIVLVYLRSCSQVWCRMSRPYGIHSCIGWQNWSKSSLHTHISSGCRNTCLSNKSGVTCKVPTILTYCWCSVAVSGPVLYVVCWAWLFWRSNGLIGWPWTRRIRSTKAGGNWNKGRLFSVLLRLFKRTHLKLSTIKSDSWGLGSFIYLPTRG